MDDKSLTAFYEKLSPMERNLFHYPEECAIKYWGAMSGEEMRGLLPTLGTADHPAHRLDTDRIIARHLPVMSKEEIGELVATLDLANDDTKLVNYVKKYGMGADARRLWFESYTASDESVVKEADGDGFAVYRYASGSGEGKAMFGSLEGFPKDTPYISDDRPWTNARIFVASNGTAVLGYCVLLLIFPDNDFGIRHAPANYYDYRPGSLFIMGGSWCTDDKPYYEESEDGYNPAVTVACTRLGTHALAVPAEYAATGVPEALLRAVVNTGERAGYPECMAYIGDYEEHLLKAAQALGFKKTPYSAAYRVANSDGTKRSVTNYYLLRTPLVEYDRGRWHGTLKRPLLDAPE